ncbi:MAG: OadG family transporter subunit [Porphyromonas sp.]|nr:OadG family transporter subunit [Porphyromonas sp.]
MNRANIKLLRLLLLALMVGGTTTLSYGVNRALRINEILLDNQQGIIDEYGNRVAWIEFYNPSAATINVGGMYLTDDLNNPKKYPIQGANKGTIISPYQFCVLYLDGASELGTFHSGLKLDPSSESTIYLFEGDGKSLIDQVTIPASIPADQSYARLNDGKAEWGVVALPTPRDYNNISELNANRLEEFQKHDPTGVVMTIIAMSVVFIALLILYIAFNYVGKYNIRSERKRAAKAAGVSEEEAEERLDVPAGVYAAIALALYEAKQSQHDDESSVITIKPTQRRYSPWSSKIYSLRQQPELRRRK